MRSPTPYSFPPNLTRSEAISAGLGVVHPALGLMFMAGVAFEVMLAENQVELAREYYEKQRKAAEDAKTATQELEAALKKIQQETSTLVNK